jgi:hypothetical protein
MEYRLTGSVFGQQRQVTIVVHDIEAEMRERPFVDTWYYIEHFAVLEFNYEGNIYGTVDISVAWGQDFNSQIEPVQQRCETLGLYKDILARNRP